MKNLFMMIGIPGSGKSTYAKELCEGLDNTVIISRDEIRYSLVPKDEEYFSKETLVFNTFIDRINDSLDKYDNVIIDATHINISSRKKVIDKIKNKENIKITGVCFIVPFEVALERNNKREGRAKVPEGAMKNMAARFVVPDKNYENYFNNIIIKGIKEC